MAGAVQLFRRQFVRGQFQSRPSVPAGSQVASALHCNQACNLVQNVIWLKIDAHLQVWYANCAASLVCQLRSVSLQDSCNRCILFLPCDRCIPFVTAVNSQEMSSQA